MEGDLAGSPKYLGDLQELLIDIYFDFRKD